MRTSLRSLADCGTSLPPQDVATGNSQKPGLLGVLPKRKKVMEGFFHVPLGTLVVLLAIAGSAAAEPSPREVRQQIDAVDRLLATRKPDDAAASLAKAIEGLEAMQAMPQLPPGFPFLADRAVRARAKLEKAGVDVTRLTVPTAAAQPVPAEAAGGRRPPAAGGVSFARQVAPFLVASCGRCHVSGRKGDFQMATYAQLMGSVKVSPGMGKMSELVEVILSGDMPPGGGRVSPDDVGMLIAWIDSGAACDADPNASLEMVARAATAPAPAIEVAIPKPAPLKPGDVSFASDIAPILIAQCGNCHGDRDPEANLRMTSLVSLITGGQTGPAVVPGKGGESLLVKKLRGVEIEGQRMPLGKAALPADQITMIAKWIDQGARIDLLTAKDSLETVAAAGRSQRLSSDQLMKLRFAGGENLWRRFIPDEEPAVELRPGLCLVGNLPAARMDALADEAEGVANRVGAELGVGKGDAGDAPVELVKGGVVIYAFNRSYDYSELWQVVLGSERPKGLAGHAGVSGDVAYGALVMPTGDEAVETTQLLLAEQIAAAALAGRGLPEWFFRGAGRAVAARMAPKAVVVQEWKRDTGGAIKSLGSATDFFQGRADPAAATVVSGGFLTSLASGNKLAQFVSLIDGGTSFEEAFVKVFRAAPAQAFVTWATRNAGR